VDWLESLVALVVAAVLVRQARRASARERVAGLVDRPLRRRALRGRRRRRRRLHPRDGLGRELPVAVELVRLGVGAGLTPADSLALVAGSPLGPARSLAEQVAAGVAAGLSFRESCVRRGAEAVDAGDDEAVRLLDLVSDGQRSGAPLGRALGVLATDLRTARRRQAEERARAVPVKLLFPLVFLALPAFVLLTIAPALLAALER
jgi:tight adherence protein C